MVAELTLSLKRDLFEKYGEKERAQILVVEESMLNIEETIKNYINGQVKALRNNEATDEKIAEIAAHFLKNEEKETISVYGKHHDIIDHLYSRPWHDLLSPQRDMDLSPENAEQYRKVPKELKQQLQTQVTQYIENVIDLEVAKLGKRLNLGDESNPFFEQTLKEKEAEITQFKQTYGWTSELRQKEYNRLDKKSSHSLAKCALFTVATLISGAATALVPLLAPVTVALTGAAAYYGAKGGLEMYRASTHWHKAIPPAASQKEIELDVYPPANTKETAPDISHTPTLKVTAQPLHHK